MSAGSRPALDPMIGAFLKSVAFGLLVAASIGPIALLIMRTAAVDGLRSGCHAALGAALADFAYALLAFSAGALVLPQLAAQARPIRISAALVLIGFATMMIRREFTAVNVDPVAARRPGKLLPTFLLTLINPLTLVVFAGFVPQLPVTRSLTMTVWLTFGVFTGSLLIQLLLAVWGWLLGSALPDRGRRRTISLAGATGVLAFGLFGLFSST